MNKIQKQRLAWRTGFFLLFILAPVLDLFRFDLEQNHFYFLTFPWTLGIDAFRNGEISALEMALNMGLRFFLPLALIVGIGIWVAWKWGRLYCGWLCPHFSVVETINHFMRKASGKLSIWDREALPEHQADGTHVHVEKKWWWATGLVIVGFSFVWAVVLLTYLLPPREIYYNLFHGELTRNQALFIGVATFLFVIEFTAARHLFCRFGCVIGLAQSLVWMGNKKALTGRAPRNAPSAMPPANTPAPCASSPAASSAKCSPAPSACSAWKPAKRCMRVTAGHPCCTCSVISAPWMSPCGISD